MDVGNMIIFMFCGDGATTERYYVSIGFCECGKSCIGC